MYRMEKNQTLKMSINIESVTKLKSLIYVKIYNHLSTVYDREEKAKVLPERKRSGLQLDRVS